MKVLNPSRQLFIHCTDDLLSTLAAVAVGQNCRIPWPLGLGICTPRTRAGC